MEDTPYNPEYCEKCKCSSGCVCEKYEFSFTQEQIELLEHVLDINIKLLGATYIGAYNEKMYMCKTLKVILRG